MSFYDDQNKENFNSIEQETTRDEVYQLNDNNLIPTENKQKQTNKWAMLISGISGGLIVGVIGFLLIMSGIIPQGGQPSTNTEKPTNDTKQATISENGENNVIQTLASTNNTAFINTLQDVSKAVVGVTNIQQAGLWTQSREAGTGSGVIYKKQDGKAYVVTNNHVVEGATEVEVILADGEHVSADVLGADQLTDLAVLEMDGNKVTQVATFGNSGDLLVGETAIAIGNPLGTEFAGSVTKGIISGLERSVEMDLNQDGRADWTTEVIQTDAAINPGNSGGALINSKGEVIGINSMKIARDSVEGIGFAIPIDSAKPIIEQLETNGKVARPFMGISAVALSTVPNVHKEQTLKLSSDINDGIVVAEVQENSPADQAGLKRYDVITKLNDKDITSMMSLKELLYSETKIGDTIDITYYREGQQQTTSLTLSKQG